MNPVKPNVAVWFKKTGFGVPEQSAITGDDIVPLKHMPSLPVLPLGQAVGTTKVAAAALKHMPSLKTELGGQAVPTVEVTAVALKQMPSLGKVPAGHTSVEKNW